MSETHTKPPAPDAAASLAAELASAPFVRLYAHADGDSLAAAGLLAGALNERSRPFQVHVSTDPAGDIAEANPDDDSLTLAVTRGQRAAADHALPPASDSRPASVSAAAVSHELGVEADPLLGLAGVIASGSLPGTDGSGALLEAAEQAGLLKRRPGVAIPTADVAEGLACSTLFEAPFSGDCEAVDAVLDDLGIATESTDLDEAARTRVASRVALDVSTAETATPAAAEAVETALRPYATPGGPFATLGGYADVLSVLACEQPGLAVSLALGADLGDNALDVWREHATAAHNALEGSTTGRYEGVVVLRVETNRPAAVSTVGRVADRFRSPEPVTFVVSAPIEGGRHTALTASEPAGLGAVAAQVADEYGGQWGGTPTAATIQVDGEISDSDLIAAVREALG